MKLEQYDSLYQQSIDDPETFWQHQANNFLSFDSLPYTKFAADDTI